jgi:hypothetical protein
VSERSKPSSRQAFTPSLFSCRTSKCNKCCSEFTVKNTKVIKIVNEYYTRSIGRMTKYHQNVRPSTVPPIMPIQSIPVLPCASVNLLLLSSSSVSCACLICSSISSGKVLSVTLVWSSFAVQDSSLPALLPSSPMPSCHSSIFTCGC